MVAFVPVIFGIKFYLLVIVLALYFHRDKLHNLDRRNLSLHGIVDFFPGYFFGGGLC